jgi:hypothetical protein
MALLDGEAEALTRKAIEKAKEGDGAALRLCIERIIPARKDRSVSLALPKLETAADSLKAVGAITLKLWRAASLRRGRAATLSASSKPSPDRRRR